MTNTYIAPKLTKYGKIENIIQAGSVALETGDLTGDGAVDQAFDTNGDGKANAIVGGANGGITPVTFLGNATDSSDNFDFYDSDGDGQADFVIGDFMNSTQSLQTIDGLGDFNSYYQYIYTSNEEIPVNTVANAGIDVELSSDGGWNDPARD